MEISNTVMLSVVGLTVKGLTAAECAALNLSVQLYGHDWDTIPSTVIGESKLKALKTEADGKMHQMTKDILGKLVAERVSNGK
jgi:hypothetical protein